jgi:hypothetical protein
MTLTCDEPQCVALGLTAEQHRDLVEYLKSL